MMTLQQHVAASEHLSTLKTPRALSAYMRQLARAFSDSDPLFAAIGEQAAMMAMTMEKRTPADNAFSGR